MILISGSGASADLTTRIANILKKEFNLQDRVEIWKPKTGEEEAKLGSSRSAVSPPVLDRFKNTEMRAESGKAHLYDLRDSYVAVVKHLYDHPLSGLSVNDNMMEVRYIFDLMRQVGITTLKKALVVPYLPFVGAHSIEKYQRLGFYEADRLDVFVRDLRDAGIDDLFSIHPHSLDIITHCSKVGINTHMKDSFTGPNDTDYCKLGFRTRREAHKILSKMHPFTTYLEERKKNSKKGEDFVFVVPDDGAERIMKMMVVGTNTNVLDYSNLLYFLKQRQGEGRSTIIGVKRFSGRSVDQIRGTTCVLVDDVMRSGKSVNDAAEYLLSHGAKSVEAWATHAEMPGMSEIKLQNLNRIVCVDTMPHQIQGVQYLTGAGYILAASIFRNYCNELEKKGEELSFLNINNARKIISR